MSSIRQSFMNAQAELLKLTAKDKAEEKPSTKKHIVGTLGAEGTSPVAAAMDTIMNQVARAPAGSSGVVEEGMEPGGKGTKKSELSYDEFTRLMAGTFPAKVASAEDIAQIFGLDNKASEQVTEDSKKTPREAK